MASRLVKIANTLRHHKKKTIVAGVIVYYAGSWVHRWNMNNRIRSFYAKEAVAFGQQTCSAEARPRRLTVLANTSANERHVWDEFSSNALPLFHLAGIQVDVIKTDGEAQLESLAAVINEEEADALFIVGGDGTVDRVITGIFRGDSQAAERKEVEKAALPIGIAPGGYDCLTLKRLLPQEMMEEFGEERCTVEEDNQELPRYGLGGLAAGWFRHIEERRRKLWYWGGLKRRVAYLWEMVKRSPAPFEIKVTPTHPCRGCRECRPIIELPTPPRRWWHLITGAPRHQKAPATEKDYSDVENENCGVEKEPLFLKGTEMELACVQSEDAANLSLRVSGDGMGRIATVLEGWRRSREDKVAEMSENGRDGEKVEGGAFAIRFNQLPSFVSKLYISGDAIPCEEGQQIIVKSTNKKVNVYLPENLRVQLSEV